MAAVTLTGATLVTPANKGNITVTNSSGTPVIVILGNPGLSNFKDRMAVLPTFLLNDATPRTFSTPNKDYGMGLDVQRIYLCPVGASPVTLDIS